MNKNEKFVITINRELGSGGRTVGRILAEKLGVPYYDKALTKALEEKFDLSHTEIEKLKGNNRSWWEEI
jgi:cytidylate kinase